MHTMDNLRDMLEDELSEIVANGTIDDHNLECIYKIVDVIKDIGEIEMRDGGYSERGRMGRYSGRRYGRNSYRDGDMMTRMEDMMNTAQTEEERNMIRRIMNQM